MDTQQVVGAVILRGGKAFVIKRSLTRRLFPGCWDLPGGHVDGDEKPLHALAREMEEETGWTLRSVVAEIAHHRWQGDDGTTRAETDYLVTVDGDLDHPRLEEDKHPEHRWVTSSELDLLSEGRKPGGCHPAHCQQSAYPRRHQPAIAEPRAMNGASHRDLLSHLQLPKHQELPWPAASDCHPV